MYRNCQVVNNIVELISWDFIDVILHAISKTNCDFMLPIWLLLIQDDIPGIFDFWDTLGGQGCGSPPCRIKPISHNFDDSPKFMGINPHSTIKLLMAMKTLCFPSAQWMMVNFSFALNPLHLSFNLSKKTPKSIFYRQLVVDPAIFSFDLWFFGDIFKVQKILRYWWYNSDICDTDIFMLTSTYIFC